MACTNSTLRTLADEWVRARAAAKPSPSTLRAQRADLAAIGGVLAAVLDLPADTDPLAVLAAGNLTLAAVESAFAGYAATHARASVLRARSTWNGFFDWLVGRGAMVANPLPSVAAPARPKRLPKALDDADTARVLAAAWSYVPARERSSPFVELDRALAAVLFGAGLRAAEVVGLTVGSVLRRAESLVVLAVAGKGSKDRTVPLPPEMVIVLDGYLAERERRHGRPRASAPLFVTAIGEPVTYHRLAYRVQGWFAAAAVKGSPHTARHTYATALTANGAAVEVVSELLGHASLQTTQIYQKVSAARVQEGAMANPLRRTFAAQPRPVS